MQTFLKLVNSKYENMIFFKLPNILKNVKEIFENKNLLLVQILFQNFEHVLKRIIKFI